MNVSIATVAEDVGTTITGIQTAITLYTLVMAMPDDHRRQDRHASSAAGARSPSAASSTRAGSLTTALAPNLPVLIIGWSFLEGIGAALIMPAIVALVAGELRGRGPAARPTAWSRRRARSRSPSGRSSAALVTTYASWRYVFVGEVVVVVVILVLARRMTGRAGRETPASRPRRRRAVGRRPGARRVRGAALQRVGLGHAQARAGPRGWACRRRSG